MSSYKNNRICYMPDHLILRHVESILNDNPMDNDESADSYFRERIDWTLDVLKGYARALKEMRQTMACNMALLTNPGVCRECL